MVPHATNDRDRLSSHSSNSRTRIDKFPDFAQGHEEVFEEDTREEYSRSSTPAPLLNGLPAGLHSSDRWPARKAASAGNWGRWTNGHIGVNRKGRQKSLSEAIETVRARRASITENAQEIAEALKAPVSFKLVILCAAWFSASILTNASSKAILTALHKPVTLTIVQFLLVCLWCLFFSWLAKHSSAVRNAAPVLKNGIRKPSKEIILTTLPLTAFQIGGHILNADAMARIPVALVHTIKGLSPLMTVFAYRLFFDARYSIPTYLSLIPLTIGVILACSASFQGNAVGLFYAFGSAILFVTQNIVSKQLFNDAAKAEADGAPIGRRKPDKLNLLCYSSALACLITLPIWVWSEGLDMAVDYWSDGSIDLRQRPDALDHGPLALEFLFNGTFHFGQSLVAFVLLGMVSPVTYSVASLIKRVAVILFAIVWFGNPMTSVQGFGFALTFLGLYLYDRTSDAAKADKRAREKIESSSRLLPLTLGDAKRTGPANLVQFPFTPEDDRSQLGVGGSYTNGKPVGSGPGRPRND